MVNQSLIFQFFGPLAGAFGIPAAFGTCCLLSSLAPLPLITLDLVEPLAIDEALAPDLAKALALELPLVPDPLDPKLALPTLPLELSLAPDPPDTPDPRKPQGKTRCSGTIALLY